MQTITLGHLREKSGRLQEVAQTLASGGLVVYPTDTVYGLAADATNQAAVDKLRAFKGQRGTKPISIAVANQAMAEAYVELNDTAKHLYQTFLPGPLTIVSKIQDQRPKIFATGIASIEGTVGVRIIPHPFVQALMEYITFPITATSANISNAPNPRSLEQWLKSTPEKKQQLVDLFIDAGELPYRKPSTVIDTSKEATEIVRPGAIDLSSSILHQSSNAQTFTSHSPEETKQIAQAFLQALTTAVDSSNSSRHPVLSGERHEPDDTGPRPILLALQGELGAGKTVFTQGLAQALGIKEPLRSPTYTLVKEYKIHSSVIPHPSSRLFHIDAWRLHSPEEFQDLALNDMLKPGNIIVIEWPQRLTQVITASIKTVSLITISIIKTNESSRLITIENMWPSHQVK